MFQFKKSPTTSDSSCKNNITGKFRAILEIWTKIPTTLFEWLLEVPDKLNNLRYFKRIEMMSRKVLHRKTQQPTLINICRLRTSHFLCSRIMTRVNKLWRGSAMNTAYNLTQITNHINQINFSWVFQRVLQKIFNKDRNLQILLEIHQ